MPKRSDRTRINICNTAARLIAETGITDYTQAKRKAVQQLGLAEETPLPTDAEIEEALREWLSIFQDAEQAGWIDHLRRKAVELMSILQEFRPYLTGPVLTGTAGSETEIDLQLFADSAKEVEIFLLNKGIPYHHATPRNDRAEAVLVVESDDAVANLVVYPALDERIAPKTRDGRPRERARISAVIKLLTEAG